MTNSKLTAAALVAAFATIATPVLADVNAMPDFGFTSNAPSMTQTDSGPKSEDAALALSIAGTLAGPALMAAAEHMDNGTTKLSLDSAGLLLSAIGPSAGHWYAGQASGGAIALRTTGILLMGTGIAMEILHGVSLVSSDDNALSLSTTTPTARPALRWSPSVAQRLSAAPSTTSSPRATPRASTTNIITACNSPR